MKRVLIACCLVAGGLFAADANVKHELVATAELASFGDIAKKATALGTMINNPIVPTLLLGSGQQQLTQTFGRFRSDSPMYWQIYLQTSACETAMAKGEWDVLSDACDAVLIYPSVEGQARMALSHPGSTKEPDGTLHILAGENCPSERWVKFTEDGRYCAIADSAALANRAIIDFAAQASARTARAAAERPLVRLDVLERGLSALASIQDGISRGREKELTKAATAKENDAAFLVKFAQLQSMQRKHQMDLLKSFSRLTIAVDLDDRGLSVDAALDVKSGAKPMAVAGAALPAGALDAVPADAALFGATLNLLQCGQYWSSEADFRASMALIADFVRVDLVAMVKADEDLKKYAMLLEDVAQGTADFLQQGVSYPAVSDWTVGALAFDAAKHPYVVSGGKMAKASAARAASMKLKDRIAAALERQWLGKGLFVKTATGHVVDWAAVIDVAAAESNVATNKATAKALTTAKKTVAAVLGGTKTELACKVEGESFSGQVAVPGFKPVAAKSTGEARAVAALPEMASARPSSVFYFPLYGFARDTVLPVVAKLASEKDAQQYKTMIDAMPAAEANSAIAAALWSRKDGSYRGLLRITANEIKNFGAAFNAFTAASMASSLNEEADDVDD